MRRSKLLIIYVSIIIGLYSCSDGGEDLFGVGLCSSENPLFTVSYLPPLSLKKGSYYEIRGSVFPERCRKDMIFSTSGSLPPGLKLDQGNIVGTPTTLGSYTLQVEITGVAGYIRFNTVPSNRFTLNVVN